MFWKKVKTEETAPAYRTHKQKEIQAAVDVQMQKYWTSVNGTAFDSDEQLEAKQARLNEMNEWAESLTDPQQCKAYKEWIAVAQYTINTERRERRQKQDARKLANTHLPTLPF